MWQRLPATKERKSMNNLSNIFIDRKPVITHIMAGDGGMDNTVENIINLQSAGIDAVILGIPFSDPVADSDELTKAHLRAIESDTKMRDIFDKLEANKDRINIPLIFFTYLNPVYKFGYDAFMKRCKDCGVSDMLIADLPIDEQNEISEATDKYKINIISVVSTSSGKRINKTCKDASGFIYVLPSVNEGALKRLFEDVKDITDVPMVISADICGEDIAHNFADGVIKSDEIVKIISERKLDEGQIFINYLNSIKENTR